MEHVHLASSASLGTLPPLQGEWLSPRVINLSLQYLTHGLTLSATWKSMKPHISALLTRCVLPLMCFNDEDDELWREDPQEYIRKVCRLWLTHHAQLLARRRTAYHMALCTSPKAWLQLHT